MISRWSARARSPRREDLGRDPVAAGSLGVENLKRIVPNLVSWTSEAGENYDELKELYESVVGQWELYLSHLVREVGGVYETHKTYEQDGPVYEPVPAEKQREALQFLNEQAFQAPEWLIEADVLRRIEASGALERIREAQVGALELLLQPERMARLLEAEAMSEDAYTLGTMLDTVRDGVWNELDAGAPRCPRRTGTSRSRPPSTSASLTFGPMCGASLLRCAMRWSRHFVARMMRRRACTWRTCAPASMTFWRGRETRRDP
ncbi:MAG: hypothetical protein BRD31_05320 [Bacteroidetes bacterium QH_2_64_26]|nr:MAG: hypothetical protein BRD31_05320 [Bacteroidetes bacterium QH_2_64_26]